MAHTNPTSRSVGDPVTAADQNIVAADLNDSGWTVPTLSNSWVSYDAGAVFVIPEYKLYCGMVILHGLMKSGTLNTDVFVLPTGYRPLKKTVFACVSVTSIARVDVFATGQVQVISYDTGASNGFVSLDNVQFFAEQ